MGQARRKTETLRAAMLAELEIWTRPPSDLERMMAEHVAGLPAREATRIDRAKLDWMLMRPSECHANCMIYAGMQPGSRWVTGWWEQGAAWVMHSVVDLGNGLACMTPMVNPAAPDRFAFVPDPEIHAEFVPVGANVKRCDISWKGVPVDGNLNVRRRPDIIIAAGSRMRAALLAGEDPAAAERAFQDEVASG